MPRLHFLRILQRALFSVLLLLGAAGSARADLVTGVWDPFFGTPFTNLGFRGTATYFVPGACINPYDVRRVFNTDACSNGAMRTLSFTVEFYDAGNEVQPTLQRLNFDPSLISVNYIDIFEGQVDGVGTGYSDWLSGTIAFENVSSYDFAVIAQGAPIPAFERSQTPLGAPLGPTVQLVWRAAGSELTPAQAFDAGQVSNSARPSYSLRPDATVPEPGSLALVAAALVTAGCAARRRA